MHKVSLPVLLLLLSSLPCSVRAQDATGRVIGTVSDPSGAAVPEAKVTVINTATKVARGARTGQEGNYQVLQLPIGPYSVTVERAGFAKSVVQAGDLRIDQSMRVDVRLEVGATSETVQVESSAAGVETVNASLGGSVTSTSIINMPLNGRNVLNLVGLQAGATEQRGVPDSGGNNGAGPAAGAYSISGGRTDSVTFLLDGAVNNNLLNNGVVFNPNPDTIEEFRVITSNGTAEYGRNAGGIVSVATKSGTNTLHGSGYDYVRNDAFNANRFFNNANTVARPVLKRNQFGGSLGGPIVLPKVMNGRDKAFFFIGYQGQRQTATQTNSAVTVFTPAELNGDFSASNAGRPDPNVVKYLQQFPYFQPNPTLAARGIIDPTRINSIAKNYIGAGLIPSVASGQLFPQGKQTRNNDELTGKLDLHATENDRFTVTLGANRAPTLDPYGYNGGNTPGLPYGGNKHNYMGNVAYTKIFSPTLLNEFRVGAQRNNTLQSVPAVKAPAARELGIGITPDNPSGPPLLWFTSGLTVGFSPQGPTTLINNTYNLNDTLSWTHGRHTIKTGFYLTTFQNNMVYDYYVNGMYSFSGTGGGIGSGNDRADFLLGLPDEFTQSPEAATNIRTKSYAGFVQDEWRVSKHLVLTAGLRYEYSTPKSDTQNRSFSLALGRRSTVFPNAPAGLLFPGDPNAPAGANFSDKNDFAPRFGFAFNPGGSKTSIRGGIGVYYDILKAEDNLQFNGQAPFFGFTDMFFDELSSNPSAPTNYLKDPYGSTGSANPFPSRPPAKNIDFAAAGFLPFGGGGVYFVNPRLRTPYVYQYNLAIQREIARDLVLEASYVGNSAHKLTGLVDSNPYVLGTTHRLFNTTPGNTDTSFSYLDTFDNVGSSNYNSLQMMLEKRAAQVRYLGNLSFKLSYTYGHVIDNESGYRERNNRVPAYNHKLFSASSDEDIQQRLVLSGGWELPFERAWTSGPKRLTKGWTVLPILSLRTGFPQDVNAGLSRKRNVAGPSGAGDSTLVHANLVGSGLTTYDPRGAGNYWFKPANFTNAGLTLADSAYINNPSLRSYGTLGRNAFRGPGRTNVDLALAKETPLFGERVSSQFRFEAFNILNNVQWDVPNTNILSSGFGRVTSTYDPRIIQLALRFQF